MTGHLDSQRRTGVKQPGGKHWSSFLMIGFALLSGGIIAVLAPAISTTATSTVLGGILVVVGVLKVVSGARIAEWAGSLWQMLGGAAEIAGGILIYLNPFKGAVAIALLIVIVFIAEGVAQLGLALKVRPREGWTWLLASSLIAFAVAFALPFKVPLTQELAAGTIAGLSLVVAGVAYVVIAIAVRRSTR